MVMVMVMERRKRKGGRKKEREREQKRKGGVMYSDYTEQIGNLRGGLSFEG